MEQQDINNIALEQHDIQAHDTSCNIENNVMPTTHHSQNNFQQSNYNTNQSIVQPSIENQDGEQPTVSHFFRQIMSVDETRISVLMIGLVFSLGFGAYMYATTSEINQNWINIIETFALCVTGINVANTMTNNNFFQNVLGNRYNQQQNNTYQRNFGQYPNSNQNNNYTNNNLNCGNNNYRR